MEILIETMQMACTNTPVYSLCWEDHLTAATAGLGNTTVMAVIVKGEVSMEEHFIKRLDPSSDDKNVVKHVQALEVATCMFYALLPPELRDVDIITREVTNMYVGLLCLSGRISPEEKDTYTDIISKAFTKYQMMVPIALIELAARTYVSPKRR